jgi:hypothetical protein
VGGDWDESLLRDTRTQLNKEVFAVVEKLIKEKGFKLRKQGHKFGLYWPLDSTSRRSRALHLDSRHGQEPRQRREACLASCETLPRAA